jgi:hypothetical protein
LIASSATDGKVNVDDNESSHACLMRASFARLLVGMPFARSQKLLFQLIKGMVAGQGNWCNRRRFVLPLMLASRSIRKERPALPSGMLDGLARMTPRSDRPPLEATDLRFGSTVS